MKGRTRFHPRERLASRRTHYNATWGVRYPGSWLEATDGFVRGVWMLGNNYQGSGYYGAYPPQYLARVGALFSDAGKVLHLFSGSLPRNRAYVTFDIQGKPNVIGDAMQLHQHFRAGHFDVIYADPPYTKADAERYGTPMPHRPVVLRRAAHVLRRGGFLVWLDTVWPMVAKKHLVLEGAILILRSQNHRVRTCFIFRKP